MLATRADTGEVLHMRQRTGSANTARGAVRFLSEVVHRVRRAGAAGALTVRADSGFVVAGRIEDQVPKQLTVFGEDPPATGRATVRSASSSNCAATSAW